MLLLHRRPVSDTKATVQVMPSRLYRHLIKPLNLDDVSLNSARRIIPPSLYWLVCTMITSDESGVDDFDQPNPCVKIEDERRILSTAEDIIHCNQTPA